MNIRFYSVELYNFMSFESASISLSENGFVRVCGENNNIDDNATSNGSGKSAIWESINWCLTGDTLRGSKDVVRHGCEDGCLVTVKFSVDGDSYEITRTKNHSKYKTNLFIKKNGEDVSGKGIRDTEKLLGQYLPDLDSNLINSIVILGQGLPMRFTNNTPAGRKDLLEVLSKSDFMICDLKNRVAERKNNLYAKKTIADKAITKYETVVQLMQSKVGEIRKSLDELNNSDLSYLSTKKKELEEENETLNKRISELNHSKYGHPISEEYDRLQSKKFELFQKSSEKVNEIKDRRNKAAEEINLSISDLKSDIRQKESEIKKLESITDVCPTCGQKIPGVHRVDTSELHRELDTLNDKLTVEISNSTDISNRFAKEILDAENEQRESVEAITKEISVVSNDKEELQGLELNISKNSDLIREISNKIDTHENSIRNCMAELKSAEEQEKDANSELLENREALSELEKHIEIQNSFENALKREFRGILLQNCISYINSKAKDYCRKIFDTDSIEFSLDGNNISISYLGKEYESLSGGEKQKIDLIIQFSIRNMLCSYLNFNCNLLVLDELTDNLDSVGCKKVIDFISTELTDIDSVFIISHRGDLEIPYDKTLNVVKNSQGISDCVLL